MHFLVIGCGSIGQRHIRSLKRLGYKVSGCEEDCNKAIDVKEIYKIEVFNNLKEALKNNYDGALICTPTSLHVLQAIEVAKKRIDLFIEKPLSASPDNINELSKIVKNRHLISLVGCNLRFSKSFKVIKSLIERNRIGKILSVKIECGFYLPYWHPYEDYRKSYSANRSLGGGVIFDDIHEIDSLSWLFGAVKEVFCYADKISNLKINTEDIAEILLKFKSGVIAQIHLDYLQSRYRRYYEFIGEKGLIIWDVINNRIELNYGRIKRNMIFSKKKEIVDKMFFDEIKHFIDCIKKRKRSINDVESAKKILEVALACHKSAKRKGIVYL